MPPVDKLSYLPDEVICHILSFLSTKCSVQTGLLSKRWKFLWAHVPSLKFDFENPKIITKIVLQHKHGIHTFQYEHFSTPGGEFESWIVNITRRNIRSIVLTRVYHLEWPQCLFTCKTLVDLCLYYCGVIPMSGIYLPALKKLKLCWVICESDEFLAHLISGCPVLEELSILGRMLGHCCVSSPTLTRLELTIESNEIGDSGLKLDTPALTYLQLFCSMPCEFSFGAIDSLIEANIDLVWEELGQDDLIYSRYVLALVGKLYNVKILTLSTDRITLVHDSTFFASEVKFHNLTQLDIDLSSNLVFIRCFLENANNLQVLCIRIWNENGIDNQYHWMEPKRVPVCMISHLLRVKVFYFGCSKEHEFDIMRYILKNAKVLKRMEVRTEHHERDWEMKSEAIKRLSLFEKGSQECKLVFD